jgi:hypothetical protein
MDTTLNEVTRDLERWENQINLVLRNAHAVYESKPLQFLADYQGITRQRAEEAKASIVKILGHALQIQAVVEQARDIHSSIVAFLPQGEKLDKIKLLLEGASITLQDPGAAGTCDLLAETSAPKITPNALLQQMQAEFTLTKKSVDEMTRDISEKENLAAGAETLFSGLPPGPKVEELRTQALAACQTLLKDPLGSNTAAASIKHLIQQIKGAEQREKDQAAELQSLSGFAAQKQEALESLKEREMKIQEELMAKVLGASTLSHAALVDRLGNWLKSLLDANQHAAIRLGGLRKWKEEAVALEVSIQKQLEADSGKIQMRDELKGRFLALEAKSADLRLSERPEIVEVIARIASALKRPSDVEKAGRSLAELSRLLVAK